MEKAVLLENEKRGRRPGGGQRKGVPKPPRKDGFAGGTITPQQANAVRWSKDRRALVQMAQAARPEAFETVLGIMRDPKVEAPTRLRAGELVLAYADGKPRQSVDVAINTTREMSTLSRAELEAIAAGSPPPFALTHQGVVIDAEVIEPVKPQRRRSTELEPVSPRAR